MKSHVSKKSKPGKYGNRNIPVKPAAGGSGDFQKIFGFVENPEALESDFSLSLYSWEPKGTPPNATPPRSKGLIRPEVGEFHSDQKSPMRMM